MYYSVELFAVDKRVADILSQVLLYDMNDMSEDLGEV